MPRSAALSSMAFRCGCIPLLQAAIIFVLLLDEFNRNARRWYGCLENSLNPVQSGERGTGGTVRLFGAAFALGRPEARREFLEHVEGLRVGGGEDQPAVGSDGNANRSGVALRRRGLFIDRCVERVARSFRRGFFPRWVIGRALGTSRILTAWETTAILSGAASTSRLFFRGLTTRLNSSFPARPP